MVEPTQSPDPTTTPIDASTEAGGTMTPASETAPATDQFEEIKQKVVVFLSELPGYVSRFFGEYQRPIITVLLIVAAIVTVKVLFAVVDALNDIPLLAPTFELIGMGYAAWFVYRYLLKASTRQELVDEVNAFRQQILGNKS
ncbi:CAAD domain-containing protein [Lyngbya sp. CCY1209]|uniref:CAAD domain-containing protein n=1 Tax=Lyngbya sp. CCY1209 TaxID=2886103 RepID=UPI002D216336|nr:CAAD domain-containing protein [Lyngbya sp. CCY1209]MEB3887451.1 CAAD domain-containing protein [Lyngbya sp. CCY1209]